jgi:hypothetical protein
VSYKNNIYSSQYKSLVITKSEAHYCLATYNINEPIAVAERSKTWVCSRSPAGIAGSNPAGDMDACLLWVLCVVR